MYSSFSTKRVGLYTITLLLLFSLSAETTPLFTTTYFSARQGLPSSDITAITQDNGGTIWIGTTDGLAAFNGLQFQIFDRSTTELPSNHITALFATGDNTLWIGTEKGIVKEKDGVFTTFQSANQPILSIESTKNGIILIQSTIGTFELSGATFIATKKRVSPPQRNWLKESQQFNIPYINTFFVDRESNKWIGTQRGLFLLIHGPFALIPTNKKEDSTAITFIATLSQSDIFASDGKKVFQGNGTGIKEIKTPFNAVYSIYSDTSATLWVATDRGIFHTDSSEKFLRFSRFNGKEGILFKDSRESLWFAKNSHLFLLHPTSQKLFTPGKKDSNITALFEDSQGVLWIGTEDGLYSKRRDNFIKYGTKNGLASKQIRTIFEDESERLWIITKESGITIRDKHSFHTLNSLNGLPGDTIFSATQTKDGTFWFCSLRGVFSISRSEVNSFLEDSSKKITIRKFGIGDGLPQLTCSTTGRDSVSLLAGKSPLFATQQGILRINSEQVITPQPPAVAIERVSSNTVPLPLAHQHLTIPGGSSLSVTLSAISIRYPDQMQFAWKLNIPNNNWNNMGSQKTLILDELEPGEYTLLFKAFFSGFPTTNSSKTASLSFIVTPQTGWSGYILFSGAVLLFFIASIFWIKSRKINAKLRAHSQKFEQQHEQLYPTHLPTTLKEVMDKEKLYTDPDLTLSQLAKKCGTNTATLSRFINSELDSTFYNLINGYRLEKVKHLLAAPEHKHSSILTLAYRAGFKSKTTFNTMFKRETHLTPTEWRKQKTE